MGKGLDISFSEPSQQWWESRRAEGFEIMVQNLWTGGFASNDGIKKVAANNLRRARLADFKIVAYANASPPSWWSLKIQMDNIKINAGAEWANITDVVIDAEIPGITMARVMELADILEQEGKTADVLYSAYWFWSGYMGNSKDSQWLRFNIWPADYDGDPTIDFPNPFGPWKLKDLIGKQYAGTIYVEKQAIDLNTFKDSWLTEDQPSTEPPIEPPIEEEEIMGKILDLFTAAGKELEAEIARAKKLPVPIKGDTGATGKTGATGATGPAGSGTSVQTYTVVSGDNLSAIASRFGVTTDALYQKNKAVIGSNPNLIQPGMVLVIP